MTIPLTIPALFGAAIADYRVARSVRIYQGDTGAPFVRTPNVSGERRAFTFSAWVKRVHMGSSTAPMLFNAYIDNSNFTGVFYHSTNADMYSASYLLGGVTKIQRRATAMNRDPSAWAHFCVSMDTRPATPVCTIEANGVALPPNQINITNAVQNDLMQASQSGVPHYIVYFPSLQGGLYLADYHFIDGQALPASTFARLDANGMWVPKLYTGNFGVNGFKLDFADNSAATAAAIGKDRSGMSNLLAYSDDYSNVFWGKGNGAVVSSGHADPFGGSTAFKLMIGSATATPYVAAVINVTAGQQMTASVYAKAADCSVLLLYNGGNNGGYGYFDLSNGTLHVYGQNIIGAGSNVVRTIESAGNGWYKCSLTVTIGATMQDSILWVVQDGGTTNGLGFYIGRCSWHLGPVQKELQYTGGNAIPDKNFTPSNITVTAGANNDSLFDSPTDYVDASGNIHGNFCVLSSIDTVATSLATLRQGGVEFAGVGAAWGSVRGTIWVNSGKWYWECVPTTADYYMFGVLGRGTYLAGRSAGYHFGQAADGYAYFNQATGGGGATRTYVLSDEAGDVAGATLGCKKLVTSAPVIGTILNVTPTQVQPQTLYAVTAAGDPGASYANGVITVEFPITGGDGDPYQVSVRAHRVSGTTIVASGTLTAVQVGSTANVYTFSIPSESLGTWGASDRLLIEYRFSVQTGQNDAIVHMGLGSASNETTINTVAGTQTGQKYNNNATLGYGSPFTTNDVIGTKLDLDAGTLEFTKNGVSQGVAYTGLTGFFAPAVSVYQVSAPPVAIVNFGQRPFAQTKPLGFKELCTYNMGAATPALPASFVGNALADGPFVWANGVVNTVTINGNVAVRGVHFDGNAGGIKLRSAATTYNAAGTNTITAATYGSAFKYARAQSNG